jgi:predicted dithiol-disulfide oxidoreductase (DUF899 family)
MMEHETGTGEEWQAARDELAKLEAEQAERNEEIKKKRRELPWVPVEKEYAFDTAEGKKSLADLFEGRSQLLPIDRLTAYKERMGWEFPYVSTYETDFPWDFGLAMTEEQAEQMPEVQEMIANPPPWLEEWSEQVGADLKDGLREGPGWIAFARENGTIYHTYTVMAPDPFVAPYHTFLMNRAPKSPGEEPRAWRKDEYPE